MYGFATGLRQYGIIKENERARNSVQDNKIGDMKKYKAYGKGCYQCSMNQAFVTVNV